MASGAAMSFMDAWLHVDEKEVLDAWQDVTDGLSVVTPSRGAAADTEAMLDDFARVRKQGWIELGFDREVPPVFFAEALKRLHRREVPLSLPLTEIWLAGRLLREMSTSSLAAKLLAGISGDGECLVLALDDLLKPSTGETEFTTGWVAFGEAVSFLLPVQGNDGVLVYLVPPTAGKRHEAVNPDPTTAAVRVNLPNVSGLELVGELSGEALARMRAETLAAQSAALVGQAQAMLGATLEYLKVREQFGVPIGSFQALKHRCADLVTDLHTANLLSGYVASLMAEGSDIGPLGYMAKAFCGQNALQIASEAIQMHGGIGFTWECNAHFGLKRCAYIAMTGLSVGECEIALGQWAMDADALLWPASMG